MADLLDRGYQRAAGATLNALYSSVSSGIIETRLQQLEAEATRLRAEGERFTTDNPVLRALLADFDDAMARNARAVDGVSEAVQETGTGAAGAIQRELTFPGMSDDQLLAIGMRWNYPDPDAINATVNYATSDAWKAALRKYQQDAPDSVLNIALRGIAAGQNPITTARALRAAVQGIPVSQANTLMRTLQLHSYRDATVLHQQANTDISTGTIVRIAALDDRTCMACIRLHGEIYPVGTRIDDHWNGRCTSILQVRGRAYNIQPGEVWFNSLPETQQRRQMGNAAFDAWNSGQIQLRDFVHDHDDPIFGHMVQEASLRTMLARNAAS